MQTPFGHDVPVYDMERMICDVLRSLSRKNAADAQILMRNYMAEKLETIITRTAVNTRMRNFYDIAILQQIRGDTLNPQVLHDALLATAPTKEEADSLSNLPLLFL